MGSGYRAADRSGRESDDSRLHRPDDDGWAIRQEQTQSGRRSKRIFPYNSRSLGTAFRRACKKLGIQDLHFHDLRHEARSRLFEAGLSIEQVALVTGHKDWKMLKRYANLRPEGLRKIAER